MNSDLSKIKYIECNKGSYHQGQLLNIVCLNQQCKTNPLCCCACVDENHNGHKTTTLKKLLIDSKSAAQKQGQKKQSVKNQNHFNIDIIYDLIQTSKHQTFQKYKKICDEIKTSLNQIEDGFKTYYTNLEQAIQSQGQGAKNLPIQIFQSIENIQGSSNASSLLPALQKLLASLDSINKNQSASTNPLVSQDSLVNFIEQSNKQFIDVTTAKLTKIKNQIVLRNQMILESASGIKDMFQRQFFHFSTELKSNDIWVSTQYKAVSKKTTLYQAILMEPGLNTSTNCSAFKFKINKSANNWIAIGMGHKNALEKNKFIFDYKSIGHGCYMISSNGGSWSNITEQVNNKVKAFKFNEGDVISCFVNRRTKEITFVKQIPPNVLDNSTCKKQIYELPFIQNPNDPLHPCVVFYYENDEVQHIPITNLNNAPKYQYLFSQSWKHSRIKIIDNKRIIAAEGANEYRSAVLNKCLEQNFGVAKKFSFKIEKSQQNAWVAVGMCHLKTASSSNYGFNFQSSLHGHYLISSNGGSWSSIDSTKNNVVKAFKFIQGDIIQCEVKFGNTPVHIDNKIIFRKGIESYQLNFKGVQGDRLYPCAMLFYANDQIRILPEY